MGDGSRRGSLPVLGCGEREAEIANQGPLAEVDLEASRTVLDAIPFPVTHVGGDYQVRWANEAARAAYGGDTGTCHALSHGYKQPCDAHGEACPKQSAEDKGHAVSVTHAHTTATGMGLFLVMALPVASGGVLEFHVPMSEGLARDALTELYSREFFEQVAKRNLALLRRLGQPYSIALLDVDHFKTANDTYGHAAGDEVLRSLGQLLTRELREVDVCGRWGGDELVMFFPATGSGGGTSLLNRLMAKLRRIKIPEYPDLRVTASIGMACMASPDSSFEKALAKADEALYKSKRAGRNGYVIVEADAGE